MQFKKRRFTGVFASKTIKHNSISAKPRVKPTTKPTENKGTPYSCADSIITKGGNRIEITTVPERENRLATARCFTANVWTPKLEESMPELSDVKHRNPHPVSMLDKCGLPLNSDGRIDLEKLRCPIDDEDDEGYNPVLVLDD